LLRNPDAHQNLSSFTQLGSFGYKPQSPKVHVGARDDGDELLSSADQVVAHDMGFETGKGESTSRFWYRSSLCKVR
jgi:hypothetical protein